MEMEIKRIVTKEVEETVTVELKKYWVIRIIQGVTSYKCIEEIELEVEPNEQEIASVLAEYGNRKVFASVEVKYRLVY